MNLYELFDLAVWYRSYFKTLKGLYNELHGAISNNATQASKQPIEGPLVALVEFLSTMEVGQLSLQQLALLEDLAVRHLIGQDGVQWIERVVRAESYDPATTDTRVGEAIEALGAANQKLAAYEGAVDGLGLNRREIADEEGRVTVRIGFREDASIDNVKDWKTSADDWYQIVRGLALISGEAPEDTRVIGASTGSIILIMSMTYALSKLLATIAKHITGTAKEILTVQIAAEELRQKRIMTKAMEAEFEKIQSEKKIKATKIIESELKKLTSKDSDGEKSNALSKSIEKLLEFSEGGGDIDFVAPTVPSSEEQESDGPSKEMIEAIESVRKTIIEYQEQRESVKLLTHGSTNGE